MMMMMLMMMLMILMMMIPVHGAPQLPGRLNILTIIRKKNRIFEKKSLETFDNFCQFSKIHNRSISIYLQNIHPSPELQKSRWH